MLPLRSCLLTIIRMAEHIILIGVGETHTALHLAASRDIHGSFLRGEFWAKTVHIYHLFMCRTPIEMVSTETRLVDTIGTFRLPSQASKCQFIETKKHIIAWSPQQSAICSKTLSWSSFSSSIICICIVFGEGGTALLTGVVGVARLLSC